ncbi:hypothetical protein EB169_10320 [archaeon]|nr:hypothetical protein [archaeon]NDB56209.1 hypothetical protein [archaeon]
MTADKKSSPQQIVQSVYEVESNAISVRDATNLVPSQYDEMILTYQNTNTDPNTITYKFNGSIITVLGFDYDSRGRLTRVYRQS